MPIDMNVQTPQEYNLARHLKPKIEQVQVLRDYETLPNRLSKAGYILDNKPTTIHLKPEKEPSFLEKMAKTLKSIEVITPSIGLAGGNLYLKTGFDSFQFGWYLGF